jgi:hypothetical protein
MKDNTIPKPAVFGIFAVVLLILGYFVYATMLSTPGPTGKPGDVAIPAPPPPPPASG